MSVNKNGIDYSEIDFSKVPNMKMKDEYLYTEINHDEKRYFSIAELDKLHKNTSLRFPEDTPTYKREVLLEWGKDETKGRGQEAALFQWDEMQLIKDAEKDYQNDYEVDMGEFLTPTVVLSDTNYTQLDEIYINAATHEVISKEEYDAIENREDSADSLGLEADVNDSYYYLYGLNSQFIDTDLIPAFEKYLVYKLSNTMINTDDEFSIIKSENACFNEFISAARDVFVIRPEHEEYIAEKCNKVMYDIKIDLQHGGERFGGHT